MGLSNDILVESGEEFLPEMQGNNSKHKEDSKNGYVASTLGGARPSS